jgi:dihydrofolate synthase/folylpolyglutamate synthase
MAKYQETLDFMFSQLPMYQRVGQSAFKKNLDNILKLCDRLGDPHQKFKSIHVAGTNGKGSTTHLIAYGLQVTGYKVGVYTSPHYRDFRERIKVNGTYIPKSNVVSFINEHKDLLTEIKPSFFEMTVAMAFDYFANQKVDFAVIEVGLGGRLDSTNIITPLLSVITNISFDHMAMLGNDLFSIAKEKAGIIKPHVPVVIGETQSEVSEVFLVKAEACQSEIFWADQKLKFNGNSLDLDSEPWLTFEFIPLKGEFQKRNIVTALFALKQLELMIDWKAVQTKFVDFPLLVKYIGRWQKISENPDVIVDSAHNIAGLKEVVAELNAMQNYNQIHYILGFANDKDVNNLLALFPDKGLYYFVKANVPRGLDAHILKQQAGKFNFKGKAYASVRRALAAARIKATPNDLIFVGGSIFVVAEVV